MCAGDLSLSIREAEERPPNADEEEILEAVCAPDARDEFTLDVGVGALLCDACRNYYPIFNGVPRMLTYVTAVAQRHAEENQGWIRSELPDYSLPRGSPSPGEKAVLRNFSTEWTQYTWDGERYWGHTVDETYRGKRYELGLASRSIERSLVLELGIGIGGTADMLARRERCEVVGLDLGYAVDSARAAFGANPLFHIVQGSVFAPPFKASQFDTVYSHGVLHHTFDTRAAIHSVAKLPKSGGMLYVWVYSPEQESHTLVRRTLMVIERVVRPIVSKLPSKLQTIALLPTLPAYLAYQNIVRRRSEGAERTAKYGYTAALHAARDRLTPPYAHRHDYEEVADWFRDEGYGDLQLLKDDSLPAGLPLALQLNTGVRGFRAAPAKP